MVRTVEANDDEVEVLRRYRRWVTSMMTNETRIESNLTDLEVYLSSCRDECRANNVTELEQSAR